MDPERPGDRIARILANAGTTMPPVTGALNNSLVKELQESAIGSREFRGPKPFQAGEAPSFFGGFLKTVVHGASSGLIGRDPDEAFWDPEAVSRFAQNSPWFSLAGELVGSAPFYSIPFLGEGMLGLRLTKAIPGLSRAVAFATSPTSARAAPLATAAAKEALRFIPLELARLGGATLDLNKEGSVPKVIGQIALELPVMAAFGGAAKALRGSSTFRGRVVSNERQIQNAFDFYNLNGTAQERLRQTVRAREVLRESAGLQPNSNLDLLDPKLVPKAVSEFDDVIQGVQSDLRAVITSEVPPPGNAYIRALAGEGGKATASNLNSILSEVRSAGLQVRKFVRGKDGYAETEALQMEKDLRAANITQDSLAYVQHPRVIETTNEAGTKRMKLLLSKMQKMSNSIGEDTHIGLESDGGAIIVKRISKAGSYSKRLNRKLYKNDKAYEAAVAKETALGRRGAKYVIFRTDAPLNFEPRASAFEKVLRNIYKPIKPPPTNALEAASPVFRIIKAQEKAVPIPEELLGVPSRHLTKFIEGRLGTEQRRLAEVIGRRVDHLGSELKRAVSPGLMAFSKFKRAQRIWSLTRATHNMVNALIETEFYGVKLPTKARTLIGSLFEVPEFKNSPYQMLQALDDKAMSQLTNVWLNRISITDAKRLNYSSDLIKFLKAIEKNDVGRTAESVAVQARAKEMGYTLGEQDFIPLENHYGLVRSWVGYFRHAVKNEDGKIVGYGSGHRAVDATADAQRVVARAEEQGPSRVLFLDKAAVVSNREEDLLLAHSLDKALRGSAEFMRARSSLAITPPASQIPSKGMLGGVGYAGNLTKKEVADVLLSNIVATRRNNLNIALQVSQFDELAKLRVESPTMYTDLINRMNLRAGHAPLNGISAQVNKVMDLILAPYLGKNSATQIINTINQGLYTLTLGMLDLGFAAVNLTTPIITSMPELAFLGTAPPEIVGRYYSTLAGATSSGIVPFKALDPLRVLTASVRDLFKVRPGTEKWEFFQRAVNERIIDPKFIEEFTGQSSAGIWGKHAAADGWASWLFKLSNFPAAKSEELSRGTSFMMGLNFGKDFYALEGERLFQFAREFTERTQFLYTAADRPRLLTGPLGQAFGLFKNWGMHHMGLLASYHGEAFLSGNFAPLLWTAVGTGAVGGIGAMPWLAVADKFSQVASDKGLQENLYDAIGYNESTPQSYFADTLWSGLPGMWDLSLQGRATAITSNPVHDVSMMTSLVMADRAVWMGDFLGSALNHADVTRTPLASSRELMDKFVRATLPRTFYRFMSINKEGQLRSLRTQGQLISKISVPDHLAYALGFNPLEIDKFFTVDGEAWKRQDTHRAVVDALGSQMTEAIELHDLGAQRMLMGRAVREGVDIMGSVMQRFTDHRTPRSEREWRDTTTRAYARAIGAGK
jgi:hypothetical protein